MKQFSMKRKMEKSIETCDKLFFNAYYYAFDF